ncbi:MAG: class I SAM-dependent methyltransferase [Archaeoglobus sp.]|uniref:class I SAM-dependent methyltransferase n=1 Tax=Archaeoglobus sp. TaxID=1872626 RepID=UPI001D32FFCB|nr:class I SAM-dependent methyltransferase [Archaeoglobus sp.]MBO8180439.1 class I SAM-dependent methyltransferase [Archaeoglobus sp.]
MYLTPVPSQEKIEDYYTLKKYYPHILGNYFIEKFELAITKELKILSNMLPGKILDVGCGSGKIIAVLEKLGWDVYGIDLSSRAIENAKKRGLKKVYVGELTNFHFPKKYFDVVLMRHVIEHIHNPNDYLSHINKILKDDGLLIISVPNINSREFKIFREYWYQLDVPRHLHFFNIHTLSKLLSNNKFNVINKYEDYRPFFSLSRSLVNLVNGYLCSSEKRKHKFKILIDNPIFHLIMLLLFFYLHLDTSIIVIAKKV